MLTKLTSKNQVTIPKAVLGRLPRVQYFEVELKDGVVLLKPVRVYDTDLQKIREKIEKLGLAEDCVGEAVRWARSK